MIKVLIVEDDVNFAGLLKRFIEQVSSNVTIAYTMEAAMREIDKASDIDIITLDAGLPDSRAMDTLHNIRVIREKRPNALIIVVTGMRTPEVERVAMEEGADGVIFKEPQTKWQHGFLATVKNIMKSTVRSPERFLRSVDLLEKVVGKMITPDNPLVNENKDESSRSEA